MEKIYEAIRTIELEISEMYWEADMTFDSKLTEKAHRMQDALEEFKAKLESLQTEVE